MSDAPAETGTPEIESESESEEIEFRTPKGDTVRISEFSAFERAYLKSTEREKGFASKLAIRRRIEADQRVATRNLSGRVPVREQAGKFQTTSVTGIPERQERP